MDTDTKHMRGMGFDITRMDVSEHPEFPCHFHKLDEELSPMSCPETPHLFVSLLDTDEGLSMCRKHFTRFVFDMMNTLEVFELDGADIMPPEAEDGWMTKDGDVITMSAFYETFMRVKREKYGAN